MMNAIYKNTDVKAAMDYYDKIKLEQKRGFLKQLDEMKLERMKMKASIPKSKAKKKPVSGVHVTGSTKRSEIKSYIATLKQKIEEIMMSDEDKNEKMARANLLQMKISDLERIIAKQIKQEIEKQTKKRKKIKDRVYLTKDDLTLNDDEDSDDSGTDAGSSGANSVGNNFDISTGSGEVSVDGDLGGESELDLEA